MFYIPNQVKILDCRNLSHEKLKIKVREEIENNIPFTPQEVEQGKIDQIVLALMNFPYENAPSSEPVYFDSFGNFIINISLISPGFIGEFSKEA